MKSYLKTYQVKLKALGPVHIGGGEKIGKKEFIYDSGKSLLYYPDMPVMVKELRAKRLLERYERFLRDDYGDLFRFLSDNNIRRSAWWGEPLEVRGINERGFNGIGTFIKDAYGLPYVPGSSVKGAFRTVILNQKAKDSKRSFPLPSPRGAREAQSQAAKDIETDLLNILNRQEKDSDALNDVMAAFRFGDSEPLKRQDVIICRKWDAPVKSKNKEPKPLPVFRECLKPGTEIIIPLTVDTRLTENTSFADLFEMKRDNVPSTGGTKEMLAFMAMLTNYNAAYRKEYLSHFDPNLYVNHAANALYIGGGVGFMSKTMLLGVAAKDERVRFTSKLLSENLFKYQESKHKHRQDVNLGVSPHTLKVTKYNNECYEMGKCLVEIREM